MRTYTHDEIIANRILFVLFLILWVVIIYSQIKEPDSQTNSMIIYGTHKDDGDCTYIKLEKDIFWTDVYIGCKLSTPSAELHGFTLRYVTDFDKHYIGSRSNIWCKDITGEYSYTPCEKIFAYRKYF